MFHLLTHAFFKALLFLGSGAVIHAMHEALHHTHSKWDAQDMRNMGGLKKYLPITWVTMWIGTLAISGVWPFAGFFSKDEIIWQAAARAVGPFAVWFRLYWIMALIAALLTAFYMTRLMIMTFHGESRLGEKERHHLHEVPPVMYVPLVVLAVLSVVGGWINVPEAIKRYPVLFGWVPIDEWLHHWLRPVTAQAPWDSRASTGAFAESAPFGGGEARGRSSRRCLQLRSSSSPQCRSTVALSSRQRKPAPADGHSSVLYHKWYVDEFYDRVIVLPLRRLSLASWRWIDQGIIDRTVNGVGEASRWFGWIGAHLQSGQVNTYAFAVVIGVLALLGFVVLR